MRITVVIPALDEIDDLPQTIEALQALSPPPDEIVVADGGSTDGSAEWLACEGTRRGVRVVSAARGRGGQMNAGAADASGDALLFLHADARLPAGALDGIRRTLRSADVAGGAFTIRFLATDWSPRSMPIVAAGINMRTKVTKTATGDQGIFVRTPVFRALGGYRDWPLFEDVDLVARMKRHGRFRIIDSPVSVSDRRYARFGPWRTTVLMWLLRARYLLGTPPGELKRAFVDVRSKRCHHEEAARR